MRRLTLLLLLWLPGLLPAQTNGGSPRRELTREDLEPFFDALVSREIQRVDIAGAVVAVVRNGEILLAKGYGWSDVAGKVPVSPDSTLFRVASISKTFNATAVMQLVEQGKLDLDREIQDYLDFQLPRRFSDPITLRHLLTHTAGFEESAKQLPADSGESVPLARFMRETTPNQIYRPGTVTAYSNYGADLAGYIVERVSGVPFPEYIRINIFEPLDMLHSSFAHPLPDQLRSLVSKEYRVASDSVKEFEVLQGEPSGNMSSTARDMAQFMIAHLQLGRLGDRRIVSESTAKLMATTQFRTHPAVTGMAIGFFEESRDGYRIIGHGGDLSRFHSHMSLLLDEGVGFFISYNSAGSSSGLYGIREVVRDAFLKRYFPRTTPPEPVTAASAEELEQVTGPYLLSRRAETTMFRMASLMLPLTVEANPDGSIQIPFLTGPNGQPIRWYHIGELVFRTEDGSERIGFVRDSAGTVSRMAFLGGHELHQAGLANSAKPNYWLIGFSLVVMIATLVLWPVAGIIRRRYRQPLPDDGVSRGLRTLTRVVPLVNLAFLAAFGLILTMALNEKLKLDPSMDPWLRGSHVLAILGLLGTVAVLVACVRSWTRGSNNWSRLKYTALALACIGFGWFILHWNLLVWNLDF